MGNNLLNKKMGGFEVRVARGHSCNVELQVASETIHVGPAEARELSYALQAAANIADEVSELIRDGWVQSLPGLDHGHRWRAPEGGRVGRLHRAGDPGQPAAQGRGRPAAGQRRRLHPAPERGRSAAQGWAMKAKDVKVGATYMVKVSGRLAPVRLTGESVYGGWNGVNLDTGRPVRVRTARRLRLQVERGLAAATPAGPDSRAEEG